MSSPYRYFIVNKPLNMVSQFVSSHQVGLLSHLPYPFPEGTHAVGRLDINSEGLLILTTNKKVTKLLFQGVQPHKRTYLVQINNRISIGKVEQLRSGVSIRVGQEEFYTTPPCEVLVIEAPEKLYPGVLEKQSWGVNSWLLITLTEGKFRQVRKMMMAINHRCKRLIRVSIENLLLGDMKPGEVREIEEVVFFKKLNIDYQS